MTQRQGSTGPPPNGNRPPSNLHDDRPHADGPRRPGRLPPASWWLWFGLLLLVNFLVVSYLFPGPEAAEEVPYTFFKDQVKAGNVEQISTRGDAVEGTFEEPVTYPPKGEGSTTRFTTAIPSFANTRLEELLVDRGVQINSEPLDQPRGLLLSVLFSFGPALLLIGLFVWLSRRAAGQGGGLGGALTGLGRSRARRYDQKEGERVTFDDVAGIEEAENELVEIVDFLKQPERYTRLGGAAPKGVLLVGPPGTGKTLLARAVAGEAGVPFFSMSASEFVEMIVGVGASRVRDLFAQAKQAAPAIIFIDELDAIGRARGGANSIGGHDEREQTLNQILTEMDGFTGAEGVIVLGATNRPEILDSALLRPGRFDRRLVISPPDQAGRREILDVHVRDVPLAADVDLDVVAASTPGMVGAELKNLINEAAILAARRQHERVTLADFNDALEKVVLGTARRVVMPPEERRRTAHHEGGHPPPGMLTPGADPLPQISIIPRGHALGVTLSTPEADRYGYSASYLLGRIAGALGG